MAWGYLVYAAIDFGATARGGDSRAWSFLAVASVGAVACLFFGLMLVARLARRLGLTDPPPPRRAADGIEEPGPTDTEQPAPRPVGGRRAAR